MSYDLFWACLIGLGGSILFFAIAVSLILDLRRRIHAYRELELAVPDACRMPGLQLEVQRLAAERKQLQQELTEAQLTIRQKSQAAEWLEKNELIVIQKQSELAHIESRLVRFQADLETLREEQVSLQEKRAELRKECDDLEQIQKGMGDLREFVQEKRKAEIWLQENGPFYREAMDRLPIVQQNLVEVSEQLEGVKLELEETQSDCRESRQQREWLIREENFLTASLDSKRQDLQALQSSIEGYESRQAGLQTNIEELQTRLEFREQEVREIQAERELAKQSLDATRSEYDQVSAELNVKREEIIQLKSAYSTTNKLLEAAVKRWSEIGATTGGGDEDRLAELWKPVLVRGSFKTESDLEESESLRLTEQYLSGLGLQFHPRVLRAFHTSIKVAEMSPLTVLAGISGTGKSELPRRYAEGMGMHFLNLAVQPRWDSPQDMFGFFNYLENRYRATELARALVQMDRFYNEKGRGWNYPSDWKTHNLSDRMLLVLLDEMNLARVEYYFSEFLSRLETRRGVNKDDPLERRMAEISLEIGMRSLSTKNGEVQVENQPSLQLFVDTNVLFVGTMNEDETTQALSDKVVDRANVLRFGRPTRLGTSTATEVSPPRSWLSYEKWQSWIRTGDEKSHVKEDVTGWVADLNAAMQMIGRPFAHRTYQSILSYVANYPEQDTDSIHLAMADQIELKILPKFRGLDLLDRNTKQAIGSVQKVLDSLGDELLSKALQESIRQSEHQFIWHGVDRLDINE